MNKQTSKRLRTLLAWMLAAVLVCGMSACRLVIIDEPSSIPPKPDGSTPSVDSVVTPESIPAYSGSPFVALNDNMPSFAASDLTTVSYEQYDALDSLGRCGVTTACIGRDLMPTEDRGNIGQVKPSGWKTAKYDFVDGKYLYNRCHLIGFQLTGENANTRNLITGTRYLNTQGMLPFENMVADYVKETENHVMYRVTPIFSGDELVARGVQMEGYSVEDDGDGICFNVYCYNVQPGVTIDYATGDSHADDASVALTTTTVKPTTTKNATTTTQKVTTTTTKEATTTTQKVTTTTKKPTTPVLQTPTEGSYVLNTNTHKIHYPSCRDVPKIKTENRQDYSGTLDNLFSQGYTTCGHCF